MSCIESGNYIQIRNALIVLTKVGNLVVNSSFLYLGGVGVKGNMSDVSQRCIKVALDSEILNSVICHGYLRSNTNQAAQLQEQARSLRRRSVLSV